MMEYENLSDFELIRAYLSGDERSFEQIHSRYKSLADECSLELVDTPGMAEEIAAEALDRLSWALMEFHPDALDSLVSTLVYETALDRLLDRVSEHCGDVETYLDCDLTAESVEEMSLDQLPPTSAPSPEQAQYSTEISHSDNGVSTGLNRASEMLSEVGDKIENSFKRTIH